MATNPDSIGNFLKSLGPQLEKLGQPQQVQAIGSLEVRVMFARSNGLYPVIVHLVALGRGITEKDLEGELFLGQWTFKAESLLEFSGHYAFRVFGVAGKAYDPDGIRYHTDPPMPTEGYGRVSYRLVPKLEDQKGSQLLETVQEATTRLYLNRS